jgi:signal transduction histidine kinase
MNEMSNWANLLHFVWDDLFLGMFSSWLNWRTWLGILAIGIVTGTIFYSNYLARKIAAEERRRVLIWAESLRTKSTTNDPAALVLTNLITDENKSIPIIETNEQNQPTGNFLNLDSAGVRKDPAYLSKMLQVFRRQHDSIRVDISLDPPAYNNYYFGDTKLLDEVRYYPIIQLLIVALFVALVLISISVRNKSAQNQLWAGLAKETAHQLGTPISSLEGWIEMIRSKEQPERALIEISKDLDRLKLITDRFGKIGSTPKLEQTTLMPQLEQMIQYMRRRSSEKVQFTLRSNVSSDFSIGLNAPLFDWVMENLLKNALDAIGGNGTIQVHVSMQGKSLSIDVRDSGSGIPNKHQKQVFKPGFTTKKRGWGLGLPLSKRIIEQYHGGKLFILSSELGKGTTFRIQLPVS